MTAPPDHRKTAFELAGALESLLLALASAERLLSAGDRTPGPEERDWRAPLERRVLPRLRGELPLIAGFCGGGNTGKSTLFNALNGLGPRRGSAVGPRAGLTRRALLAIPGALFDRRPELLRDLFEPFGGFPEPFEPGLTPSPLTEPGPPLYILTENGPPDAILVDLPDVDVAAGSGGYANRENSRRILAACDLLILIAVNQNYSNKDVTDFMRETVFAEGLRPAMLVYRYGPGPGDGGLMPREDAAHIRGALAAMTALLYPGVDQPPLYGRFLMREDTAVRGGAPPELMEITAAGALPAAPPSAGASPLREALARLDRAALYREASVRAIGPALEAAGRTLESCLERGRAVETFQAALADVAAHCARGALTLFPAEELRRELAACWSEEQNALLRYSTALGPRLKDGFKSVKRFFSKKASAPPDTEGERLAKGGNDFLAACSDLRRALAQGELRGAPLPALYEKCRLALAAEPFAGPRADRLLAAWRAAISLPPDIREVIRPYVKEARERMSALDVAREYAKSLASAGCQLAAVAYVVGTGGATLWLFGGHDVYALAAVPAILGLEHMPEAWRAAIWNDIVRKWNEARAPLLIEAVRANVSGDFQLAGETALAALEGPLKEARAARAASRRLFAAWAGAGAEGGDL